MKKILILVIQFISNLFVSSGLRACRFHPTCSHYSIEAIQRLPLHQAIWRSLLRLLRCHPLSAGGYDPVRN